MYQYIRCVNFEQIQVIKGVGNSNQLQTYVSYDSLPLSGTSYYPLKQSDYDGAFTYSKLVFIQIQLAQTGFSVSPNPSNGHAFTIHLSNKIPQAQVSVYNRIGQKIFDQIQAVKSSKLVIYLVQHLAEGIYVIKVQTDNSISSRKLLIASP